jgi:hypothetical protein
LTWVVSLIYIAKIASVIPGAELKLKILDSIKTTKYRINTF